MYIIFGSIRVRGRRMIVVKDLVMYFFLVILCCWYNCFWVVDICVIYFKKFYKKIIGLLIWFDYLVCRLCFIGRYWICFLYSFKKSNIIDWWLVLDVNKLKSLEKVVVWYLCIVRYVVEIKFFENGMCRNIRDKFIISYVLWKDMILVE